MTHDPVLLIVGADATATPELRATAERQGFRVVLAQPGDDLATLVRTEQPRVAVLRADGAPDRLADAKAFATAQPRCRTIAIASPWPAVSASEVLDARLYGVLTMPVDARRFGQLLAAVREDEERRANLFESDVRTAHLASCAGMLGRSPVMQVLLDRARRVAPHVRAALLLGEPGTGKQRLARALHALGPRHSRPFVLVECDGGDPPVLESLIFGGGAAAPQVPRGLLAIADGGVIYFDDVVRLSPRAQDRLLGVVERGEWFDGVERRHADLVILAGAVRHPRMDVQAGRFRADLLARLADVEFQLPPLRERREDVPPMVAAFLRDAAQRAGKSISGISAEAEQLLVEAQWPGNVGQLRAAVERVCLLADGDVVLARDVATALPPGAAAAAHDDDEEGRPLSSVEREHILRALQRTGGNKKSAARMLGVSRRALYRKLERLDLGSTIARRQRAQGDAVRPPHTIVDARASVLHVVPGQK